MIISGKYPSLRLRRNRKSDWIRRLTEENTLSVNDLVLPIFLVDGKNKKQKIDNMPEIFRYSIDKIPLILDKAVKYKIPMVELWGMTEMVRCIFDNQKDRKVGKRCFGKVSSGLETKVIDDAGKSILNSEGQFLIRFNKKSPTTGFFLKYNKNISETKRAWEKGWFHTGDIVIKDTNGYHYFVDRAKNIIRRSGENISSAEVEQELLNIETIENCSVLSVGHKLYEEEVFAFIVLKKGIRKNISTAKVILKKIQ